MMRVLLTTMTALTLLAASHAQAIEYIGLCEASAGAFLDDKHFVVASDETNILQLYERGKPERIGGIDLTGFTAHDKSDLEGAAVIGDRVYWISSHSLNKSKKIKGRAVFFATKIGQANGKPTLTGIGKVVETLRDPLATAAGIDANAINIEALAATPEGGLLIGLRAPLLVETDETDEDKGKEKAIVISLKNPAAVVEGSPPVFGDVFKIFLDGRGLRSMDLIGNAPARYVIVAGPVKDGPGFAIYRWAGPSSDSQKKVPRPEKSNSQTNLSGLTPEGAMAVPGQNLVQLLSDDKEFVKGVECSDEDEQKTPIAKRKFRSIDVTP